MESINIRSFSFIPGFIIGVFYLKCFHIFASYQPQKATNFIFSYNYTVNV